MNMTFPRRQRLAAIAAAISFIAPHAHANMSVSPMRATVEQGARTDVRVHSQSAEPQFVRVQLKEIVDPGTPDEREVDLAGGARAPLVASPAKFALAAGGNRLVRLVALADVEKERVLRAYFEGVPPDVEPGEEDLTSSSAGLQLNLIWGVLVHLLPKDGVVDMQLEGNVLRNTGTLRLGLTGASECSGGDCIEHEFRASVFPDAQYRLPFQPAPGRSLTLRYHLSRDRYQVHTRNLQP